jgi:hypothetical protein|tara:strand:+ start:258 stop:680 length:423 start_codon:yes stop_codon:yes gene_type:complete
MKKILLTLVLLGSIYADEKAALILDIEKSLMASCFHGTVYEHGNKEMEEQIASFVNAGRTKDYIINFYTNKYGERILAMPEAEGFNMFAWLAPIMIFILGGMVMFVYFKNSPQTVLDVPVSKKENVRFSDEIEAELKDLD